MRVWFSGPKIGFVRPGIGFSFGNRQSRIDTRYAPAATGFVYVISRENDYRIKIGSSVDPFRRLAELQTGSPDRLSIAYRVPVAGSAAAVEARAHEILNRHRGIGEWFAIPVDVAVAAIHAAAYQVSDSPAPPVAFCQRPFISMQAYLWALFAIFVFIMLLKQ